MGVWVWCCVSGKKTLAPSHHFPPFRLSPMSPTSLSTFLLLLVLLAACVSVRATIDDVFQYQPRRSQREQDDKTAATDTKGRLLIWTYRTVCNFSRWWNYDPRYEADAPLAPWTVPPYLPLCDPDHRARLIFGGLSAVLAIPCCALSAYLFGRIYGHCEKAKEEEEEEEAKMATKEEVEEEEEFAVENPKKQPSSPLQITDKGTTTTTKRIGKGAVALPLGEPKKKKTKKRGKVD